MGTKTTKLGAIDRFIALPDEEKERIYQEIDRKTTEELRAVARSPTAAERKRLAKFRRGLRGRPKVGEGVKHVNFTIEQGLLRQADAWAKDHGVSRSQLVVRGIQLVMADGAR